MKHTYAIIIACASMCLLTGCVAPTPYQTEGFRGGYTQTQFDKNVFMIYFAGNIYTQVERAFDFTMLRASEVCLQHGYSYFSVETGDAATGSFGGSGAGILIRAYKQRPEQGLSFDANFLQHSVKEKYGLK